MPDKVIEGLKPELLWESFYEISQVPRPSKKEEKVRAYLREFAKKNSVKMKEDAAGNIVMFVPASKGKESAPTVVLQGHVDMVCEKNKGTQHDFDNDPIKLVNTGEWITADGTTLGADNGIGVAAGLAMISDKEAVHGPLELLFTVDEETGLTGADSLQPGFITGKTLLNLDSEEDGAFYVGCSGGIDSLGIYNIEYKDTPKNYSAYSIILGGLRGGHSGLNIVEGRANAIKLFGRLLKKLEKVDFYIAELSGGSKRNAIPREAEALILINADDEKRVKDIVKGFIDEAMLEYKKIDGGLKITLEKSDKKPAKVFTKEFTQKIVNVVLAMPHGVIAMSPDIPGLVETSTNLATIVQLENKLRIGTSQRSSIETAKVYIAESVRAVFALTGAEVELADGYPGWQPNMDSHVLKVAKKVFEGKFKKVPEIKAIHAGLECGILGNKYPGLDMISFGPTIEGAHSPDERVNIKDVDKFYSLLKGILENLAS